jgi:hypothetical protein
VLGQIKDGFKANQFFAAGGGSVLVREEDLMGRLLQDPAPVNILSVSLRLGVGVEIRIAGAQWLETDKEPLPMNYDWHSKY